MAERENIARERSSSLPSWVAGASARVRHFQPEPSTPPPEFEEEDTPIAKLLRVLQALLNGSPVDMAAVKWLWMRIATGDFVMGAFPAHSHFQVPVRGMDKDVSASLALLLGPGSMRRGSRCSDIDAPGPSALSAKSGPLSSRSSVDMTARADSLADFASIPDDSSAMEEDTWQVAAPPVEEVEAVLRKAGTWGFDTHRLAQLTGGHALSSLGFWLLTTTGVAADLGLDVPRLAAFLRETEARYPHPSLAPYHNAAHAADVLHQMHMLLTAGGLAQVAAKREPLAIPASYLAAIVHDMDHQHLSYAESWRALRRGLVAACQGVTNDYLICTEDRLALVYNDASPQENHHVASAFQLLARPECNFLRGLSRERRARVRQTAIAMVLATDMKQHVGLMSAFQSKVDVKKLAATQPGLRRDSMRSSSINSEPPGRKQQSADACGLFDSEAGRTLAMQMALKCADLGHASAPWENHMRWVKLLEEEMFLQGDREAAAKLPISPLMDRSRDGVSKSQVDFLERVALPLFRVWASIFPGAAPVVSGAEANLERWRAAKGGKKALRLGR